MNLRCYCCGEPLDPGIMMHVALVAMLHDGDATDRVFVVKPEHVARLDAVRHEIVARTIARDYEAS